MRYTRVSNIDWASFKIAYRIINTLLHTTIFVLLAFASQLGASIQVWLVLSILTLVLQLGWYMVLLFVVDQQHRHHATRSLALAELANAIGWCTTLAVVHASRAAIDSERAGEYAQLYAFAQITVYLQHVLGIFTVLWRICKRCFVQ